MYNRAEVALPVLPDRERLDESRSWRTEACISGSGFAGLTDNRDTVC